MHSNQRRLRSSLLYSAAGVALTLAASPAVASDVSGALPRLVLSDSALEAHNGSRPSEVVDAPHAPRTTIVTPDDVVDSPQVTIRDNFAPNDIRDPNNITGIGQIITDAGGGSVGLCTGSLINPRTILFAAHCVNGRDATAYGGNAGGVGIGVGFETNTRANAPGQTDELVRWLFGVGTTVPRYQTNTAQAFYNLNQVFWDPRSRAAASCTSPTSCFLEADIATGVLDTPAAGIPTWALLFSPLATPATINPANGTGYHVTIAGYGQNGTGTTGVTGSDFRRRVAENMLGALMSLNTRNLFLFGTTGTPSRPQVLYFLDFDDPTRTNPRDFNSLRDNALPREGITGPGDSGGPLILDQTFNKPVVIGVLSGGSTFFGGQPQSSYGTQSFYQPLFLYWDWIAANNPYRYVTAVAGNRNWSDPTAWVTELDPNYNVIVNGQLVNGVPLNPGAGAAGTTPQFGEQCFQLGGTNECQNIATGAIRIGVPNNPSDQTPVNGMLVERITDQAGNGFGIDGVLDSPQLTGAGFLATPNPAPTLANGLPGATNFVPNNVDGVRTTGVIGRYFDVTLRNAGVITLDSAVTIDRFAIRGATSQLTIAAGGSLTSLIDVQQMTGTVLNNGTLTSRGDYLFMSGLLGGTGTINAPFVTSVLGSFSPGQTNAVGTLTFNGNVVFSSATNYLVDLTGTNVSDRIVLNRTAEAGSGRATLGGNLMITFAPATMQAGNEYVILTAQGGTSGTFNAPAAFSAILRPVLSYVSNAVILQVQAGSYYNAINLASPIQRAYASLLDLNRFQAGNYSTLYQPLDLQNAATIQATLEGLAPRGESLRGAYGTAGIDTIAQFIRNRIGQIDLGGGTGGSVSLIGQPVQLAAANFTAMRANRTQSDTSGVAVQEGVMAEETSAFFAGGYIDGDARPMPTATPLGGRNQFNGFYLAVGAELALNDVSVVGVAVSYTEINGNTAVGGQRVDSLLYQGTLYGKADLGGGIILDGQFSAGILRTDQTRTATIVGTNFTLRSRDNALTISAEAGLSKMFQFGGIEIGPRVSFRTSHLGFSDFNETGGPAALKVDRSAFDSVQGRAGLVLGGAPGSRVRPYLRAEFVHDFENRPAVFGANFVGGVGPNALFALPGQDQNWAEFAGGIAFDTGRVRIAVGAETTAWRSDVSTQSYRGSVSFRF